MRNTSETDYDVIKYNHMSAQTGILNSLVTRASVLSCADHTYGLLEKKMYGSFVLDPQATLFHSSVSFNG